MANKFNAGNHSIKALFDSNSSLFTIPAYQRGYSWTTEEAVTLLNDILEFSKREIDNQSYYIGNIILKIDSNNNNTSKRTHYKVVDGQQRMTTMLLIIAAIRNSVNLRIQGNDPRTEGIRFLEDLKYRLETLIYFKKKSESDELQLKIYNKDYEDNMKAVIENTINDDAKKNNAYQNNYNAVFTELNKLAATDMDEMIDSLENVVIVEIILSEEDNDLEVFENINSKGHDLSIHDLIKNYSYILGSNIPDIPKRENFNERVKKIFDTKIKDNNEEKALSTFWRIYTAVLSNNKQPINKTKIIYKEFKDQVKKAFELSGNTPVDELDSLLNKLLDSIEQNYNIWEEIESFKVDPYLLKERWERSLSWIANKSFDSLAQAIFKIFSDYKNEKITLKERNESIIALNKYKLRRKVSSLGTKDLKNFSTRIVIHLEAEEKPFTKANLLTYLEDQVGDDRWNKNIDNIDFVNNISNMNTYDNDVANEVLIEYEWSLNKNETSMTDSKRKVQIEHVMPQKIFDEKKEIYYKGWEDIDINKHVISKDKIGNLTLTFDNQEMGNKPFSDKKDVFDESTLRVNKYFKELDRWDIDSIEKRGKEISKEIGKQWTI